MEVEIDTEAGTPLLTQLIRQIKGAIGRGALRPGDALPSAHQLSNDLKVSGEVVARAYRLLELDRIVHFETLRGIVVHRDAATNVSRVGWSWCP